MARSAKSVEGDAGGSGEIAWEWREIGRDKWTSSEIPTGDIVARQIKKLSKDSFACYRNGKYMGMESTLEDAKARVDSGEINLAQIFWGEWAIRHGDVKPPPNEVLPEFLQMTDNQRKVWKHHHEAQYAKVAPKPSSRHQVSIDLDKAKKEKADLEKAERDAKATVKSAKFVKGGMVNLRQIVTEMSEGRSKEKRVRRSWAQGILKSLKIEGARWNRDDADSIKAKLAEKLDD